MKKLCYVILFALIILVAQSLIFNVNCINYINAAYADTVFEIEDNSGYIFDDKNPDIKFYIPDLAEFNMMIVEAVLRRNDDYFKLRPIGDSTIQVGEYTYYYVVSAGMGQVQVKFYRFLPLFSGKGGDSLILELAPEGIEKILDIVGGNK